MVRRTWVHPDETGVFWGHDGNERLCSVHEDRMTRGNEIPTPSVETAWDETISCALSENTVLYFMFEINQQAVQMEEKHVRLVVNVSSGKSRLLFTALLPSAFLSVSAVPTELDRAKPPCPITTKRDI